jgi:hypothetical protein
LTDTLEELSRLAAKGNTRPFTEAFVRIQDKEGKMVPFRPKPAQEHYWNNRSEADIILKAAQMGFTTALQIEFFVDAMFIPGLEVLYAAQRDDSAKRLFEITTRMYRALPEGIRPPNLSETTHNLKLDFSGGRTSTIEIGTTASKSFGRGRPVHRALFTEAAFYEGNEENTMAGIVARIPHGGRYVVESTANGQAGKYYEDYLQAESKTNGLKAHFYSWWWDPGYTIESSERIKYTSEEQSLVEQHGLSMAQIKWRRWQIGHYNSMEFFQQEFPESPEQAFMAVGDNVFAKDTIDKARSGVRDPEKEGIGGDLRYWKGREPGRNYIISIDQASGNQLDSLRKTPTDFQVATVWDATSLEQCATLRGRIDQQSMVEYVKELYKFYGEPLVVVERNHAQYGFFDLLRTQGIYNIYVHNDGKFGFPTNMATKPLLIENMAQVIRTDGACDIKSANLVFEISNYRWLGRKGMGAMGAAPGSHDDELMTAAFAFWSEVRTQAYNSFTSAQVGGNRIPKKKVKLW